jgi:hypothetical protein
VTGIAKLLLVAMTVHTCIAQAFIEFGFVSFAHIHPIIIPDNVITPLIQHLHMVGSHVIRRLDTALTFNYCWFRFCNILPNASP